jgi:hypothetical protein
MPCVFNNHSTSSEPDERAHYLVMIIENADQPGAYQLVAADDIPDDRDVPNARDPS